jgi:serine/threonine-protein kinase
LVDHTAGEEAIPGYTLLELLGRGGMGDVYLAEDPKLDRRVAVKFLAETLTRDAEAKERFRREAQAAARLDHANICTVHQIGESDRGRLYIVMAFYEGETLNEKISRGAMELEEAIRIARQAARGLAFAHRAGVIHRDVKPANLLVTEHGVVKVLDFGLAKVAAEVDLTITGSMIGTPAYMSPEQARGREATETSDIWSLGVVFYEMLTGRRPFGGGQSTAALHSILHDAPAPLGEISDSYRLPLERILGRCLAKRQEDRFRMMEELIDELGALDESNQTLVQAPARPAASTRPSIAVLPFVDMSPERDQEYFCDGLAEELISSLGRLSGLGVASRTSSFRFRGPSGDLEEIGRQLGVKSLLEGSVRKTGDRLRITVQLIEVKSGRYLWSERFDRTLDDIFEVQDEIAARVVEKLRIELESDETVRARPLGARNADAYNVYLKGRFLLGRRTGDGLQRGIEHFREATALDSGLAEGHAGLAEAHVIQAIYGEAPPGEAMQAAKEAADRALRLDERSVIAHTALASVKALYEWDWAGSERDYRRAIELAPSDSGALHAYASHNLTPRARFEQAIEALGRARDLDPLSPIVNAALGTAHYFAGECERGVEVLGGVLDLEPHFAIGHFFLGRTLTALGRPAEALRELGKATQLSGDSAEVAAALADAQVAAGNREEAEKIARRLDERATAGYVSPSLLAQASASLGRDEQALDRLERAADERSADLVWLAVRPVFARLREQPRFLALLGRLGLERAGERAQEAGERPS